MRVRGMCDRLSTAELSGGVEEAGVGEGEVTGQGELKLKDVGLKPSPCLSLPPPAAR